VKVVADRDICIGAGMCVMTAAAIFDQDDDGLVVLSGGFEVPADEEQHVRRAASLCPSGALRLIAD
jgi:ferredoxin